jgi:hypothetical protein
LCYNKKVNLKKQNITIPTMTRPTQRIPLEDITIPVLSWDIAAAIDGFQLDPYETEDFIPSGHKVALGKSRTHGPVAVKAHSKPAKADYEARRLQQIGDKKVRAFRPLAVAPGQYATYLVMAKEPKLSHLGQLNWARSIADRQTSRTLLPTLESAAADVAAMHEAGIVHGDLHAANMMYQGGGHIIGDVEGAQINAKGAPRQKGEARDVHRFGASLLIEYGFLGDRSPAFRAAALHDHLYAPYAEGRVDMPVTPRTMLNAWDQAATTRRMSPPARFGG